MASNGQAAFHDLPEAAFPVTMKAYGVNSGKKLWKVVVAEPGVVEIPPLARIHGEPVRVVVYYADGGSEDVDPEPDG
jgi:hypothetical protein